MLFQLRIDQLLLKEIDQRTENISKDYTIDNRRHNSQKSFDSHDQGFHVKYAIINSILAAITRKAVTPQCKYRLSQRNFIMSSFLTWYDYSIYFNKCHEINIY